MRTKFISLPHDLEDYVDATVASGQYNDATEVICAALRLLRRKEVRKLAWLRSAVAEGLASADRGEGVPENKAWDEIRKMGLALLKERRKKRLQATFD